MRDNALLRSDAVLACAAQNGDKRAFVDIVARHQGMVAGIALAILRDFAASEDAAQDAFLTAWKKIGELRDPSKLRAWLATIARNSALMQARKRRLGEALEAGLDLDLVGAEGRPDESAASREESAMVLAALGALPENYRLPLVLFYREEKSIRAVAEALELSEDAVKQRLLRGREMLRERVAGLIDAVLGRSLPGPVFTMTIAAAIGALLAPGAVAAAVFSAAAIGTHTAAATATFGPAAATTAETVTTATATATATTMSLSKLTLTAAAIAAICVPVGYTTRSTLGAGPGEGPDRSPATSLTESKAGRGSGQAELPDSPLVVEWKRLLEEYGTGSESLARLHTVLESMEDPFRKRAFLSALIAEWAQVDPGSGLSFFRVKGRADWQRELFLSEWIARDPGAAVAGLQASGEGWEDLARFHLNEIARRVPALVPGLVGHLPKSGSAWDTTVRDAFAILAGKDLAGSRAAAEAVRGPNRIQALSGVAMGWAEEDGPASFAWAQEQQEGEERFDVMRASLLGWAKLDPAAALDRVGLLPPGGEDMMFASTTGAQVLRAAAEANFEAAVEWLLKNPGKLGQRDVIGLAGAVQPRLVADPAGFLSRAAADRSLLPLMDAIGSALLNEASGSRLDVWEWLRTAPDDEGTRRLRENVLNGMGWQEPRAAMRLVDEMRPEDGREQAMSRTAFNIINGGSNLGMLETLLGEVTPEWRNHLLQAGFQGLRPEQFQQPERWVERLAELDPAARQGAVSSLAGVWSERDPEASAAWVASLEEPAERATGLQAVSSRWAQTDAYAAGEWIAAMPAGDERDAAALGLITTIASSDPREAWEWAESVGTAEHRFSAAQRVLGPIAQRDREEALHWLAGSTFPQDEKDRLAELLERLANQPLRSR